MVQSAIRPKDASLPVASGCLLYSDCFTCPEPDCMLDTNIQNPSLAKKNKAIELAKSGHSVEEIAIMIHRSVRQVKRYLFYW